MLFNSIKYTDEAWPSGTIRDKNSNVFPREFIAVCIPYCTTGPRFACVFYTVNNNYNVGNSLLFVSLIVPLGHVSPVYFILLNNNYNVGNSLLFVSLIVPLGHVSSVYFILLNNNYNVGNSLLFLSLIVPLGHVSPVYFILLNTL